MGSGGCGGCGGCGGYGDGGDIGSRFVDSMLASRYRGIPRAGVSIIN